jgi:hypothetical protein
MRIKQDFWVDPRESKQIEQAILHIIDTLPELYQFLDDNPFDDVCFIQSKKFPSLVRPRNEMTMKLCALFDDVAFKDWDTYKGRVLDQILKAKDIQQTHEIIYKPTIMGDTKIILRPKAQVAKYEQDIKDYYTAYNHPCGG